MSKYIVTLLVIAGFLPYSIRRSQNEQVTMLDIAATFWTAGITEHESSSEWQVSSPLLISLRATAEETARNAQSLFSTSAGPRMRH